jgi:hypothetical protein
MMTLEKKLLENALTKHLLLDFNQHIEEYSNVIAFFLIFSRFECALKSAGFVSTDINKTAKPDWNEFSNRIMGDLNTRKKECKELANAIDYLNDKPPGKQIVKPLANGGKGLGWKKITITPNVNDTLSLIESIKRIRNNLFHGAKYPLDLKHDIPLINHATTVLKYLLELKSASKVKRYYYNG